MTPSHHNPPRNAKRKAESPDEEAPPTTSGRPHRKKQKQTNDDSNSAPTSPVTMKSDTSALLQKHLLALYREVENAQDDKYSPPAFLHVWIG